jgi:cytidylate kinase
VKLFVTAGVEARAERRWKEMAERGEDRALDEIIADLRRRDDRDRNRDAAPLVAADDAIVLDTSGLNREAAIAEAIRLAAERLAETDGTGV